MLGIKGSSFQIKSKDLFLLAYCLYITTLLIESTTITAVLPEFVTTVFKLIRYSAYVLCVIKAFITARYKYIQIIYAFILIMISMITLFTSDRTLAMMTFIFLGAIDVPKNKLLKCSLKIQVTVLTVTVMSSLLGIIDNYLFDKFRGRWGLGFIWTTFAPIMLMFIIFECIYLYQKRMRIIHYFLLSMVATFFFMMTKTRFTYAVTIAFLLISGAEHYKKKPFNIIKKLGKWNILWPFFFAAFAITLQISYNSESAIWQKVDMLLSRRLYYGLNAVNKYKITAFGQKIEWIGRSYKTEMQGLVTSNDLIDNAYFRNLFLYGIAGLIGILSLYAVAIWKAVKNGDYLFVFIIITILGFCVFEFWMYNLQMNPFMLIAVMRFSQEQRSIYALQCYGNKTKMMFEQT